MSEDSYYGLQELVKEIVKEAIEEVEAEGEVGSNVMC